MNLYIKNVRIINPRKNQDFVGNILIENGKIAEFGETVMGKGYEEIDGKGFVAAPGLVDLHVHLRDPGLTHKEDVISGCNAAAAGGVTSLLCMPNTAPAIDGPEVVTGIIDKAKNAKAKVYVCSAITKFLGGDDVVDFKAMKKSGAVALSDDGRPVVDTRCLIEALKKSKELGMLVTAHCEDLFLAEKWYMNEGEVSKELGIEGVSPAAEDCGTAREIAAAAVCDAPIHICHVSTKGSCQLIRDAKRNGQRVTAETAPHYLLLTDEELRKKDADYRMNPPLRSEGDRIAMVNAILDGTIDAIATDHAPHSVEEKADFLKAPNGAIGMETSLAATLTALVETGYTDIKKVIEIMSCNPAEILGIEAGIIDEGKAADLVIFDPHEKWTVDVEKLHGKSKNCVFKGKTLTGKVKYTIMNGILVYKD